MACHKYNIKNVIVRPISLLCNYREDIAQLVSNTIHQLHVEKTQYTRSTYCTFFCCECSYKSAITHMSFTSFKNGVGVRGTGKCCMLVIHGRSHRIDDGSIRFLTALTYHFGS
jgi:hypothetical protein